MAAEAVVSMALETLGDLLLEESKFLSGVSSDVKGLETQLKEIKCLLEDADKRRHESKTVSNWIVEIRDLAHRAEDAIETYAVQISSKRGPGFKKVLRRFSCLFNEGLSLHQIGSDISEIKTGIESLTKKMEDYGIIKSIIRGESSTSNPDDNRKRQTFPIEIENCFVGKEDDLKQLVSLIVDDKQHQLISVWGMGGIGKTTIARKVYNHIETKRSFECFAWVCITRQCQIRSVQEEVLRQLISRKREDISSLSNIELIEELCQIQRTKRCMVVLDDLWEIDHWHSLKHAFLIQDSSSKLLLTTRKQNVADIGFAFELGLLNIEDGLELLKKKAFPNSSIPDSFAMQGKLLEKMGKEMVRKCGRLPLAISILGGLLSRKNSIEEWELVYENMITHLYRGIHEKENEIHGVLNLSYEDLPFYLKPCFLSMGQFREDELVHTYPLYRFWVAQGMISHENQGKDETLMDIAEAYLSELASRCLIQVQLRNIIIRGDRYKTCQLHDVVRELCLSKGENEGFGFQAMNYQCGKFSSLLNESLSDIKTRHLAIHFERQMESEANGYTVSHKDTRKHVRSLQFLNYRFAKKIEFRHNILDFNKFKLLRVLVFQCFSFEGKKLPRGIGNLIHLRQLTLTKCELDKLPSSISNLKYLHTLDLLNSRDVQVPNVLNKMHRLKHLLLPLYSKENIGNYHLTLEGLDELETLRGFNSLVHDLKSVMRIKNLRYFSAEVRDNKSLLAVIDGIMENWTKSRNCELRIYHGCQLTSTILKNVFTCQSLQKLRISVPISKVQLEEGVTKIIISRLVYLWLSDCEIEDDPMGILGKFPFLEDLYLNSRAFVGEEIKCHASGFPQLKKLSLRNLPNLREWRVEQGAMPLLSEIEIDTCPRLEMIPDGLRFIVNLQKLQIKGMPELRKRVDVDEGEDYHKVRHVPSIIIRG